MRGGIQQRLFRRASEALAIGAGWTLLVFAILVAVEVLGRKFLSFSLRGIDEIGGYCLAIISAIGFVYGLIEKAHIRVDLLLVRLNPRLQAALNVIAYTSLAFFAVLLASRAVEVVWHSWRITATAPTLLATPLVFPQGIWALGLISFAGVALSLVVGLVVALLREGAMAASKRFGPPSTEDETSMEVADLQRRRSIPAGSAEK